MQANNAPLSDSDRAAIASELRERLEALRSVANTTDVDGRHLFAGFNEAAVPFTVGPGGNVVYNGDQGQRTVQVSETRFVALNDSGADVFQRIPSGNGTFTLTAGAANTGNGVLGAGTVVDPAAWDPTTTRSRSSRRRPTRSATARPRSSSPARITSGQAISFRGIAVRSSGAPAAGDTFCRAERQPRHLHDGERVDHRARNPGVVERGTGELAQQARPAARGRGSSDESRDLEALRRRLALESAHVETSLADDFKVQLSTMLSSIRDLDYASALTQLSQQQLGLQAAQQAFAQTQGLTLFRFLS